MGITAAWYVDNRCERKQTDPKLTHTPFLALCSSECVSLSRSSARRPNTYVSLHAGSHASQQTTKQRDNIQEGTSGEWEAEGGSVDVSRWMCSCLQQRQMEATSIRQNPGEAHAGSTRSFSCPHEDVRPAVCPDQTWRTELEDTGGHQNSSFNGENLCSDLLSRPTLDPYLGPSCSSCGIPRIPALVLPAEGGCPHIWKLCSSSSSSKRRA